MNGCGEGDYGDDVYEHGTQGEYMTAAVREYAREHGRLDPTRAWISTPLDTWEPNPFYVGPRVPHPESYDDEGAELDAILDDEIPF